MIIDKVKVTTDEKGFSMSEIKYYVALVKSKYPNSEIVSLEIKIVDNDKVEINCVKRERKFERIRRITG